MKKKTKMVTKIYCDLCKKEIQGYGNIIEIKITPNAIVQGSEREEVCKECGEKINNYINNMRIKW
jgi:hypothetical protein